MSMVNSNVPPCTKNYIFFKSCNSQEKPYDPFLPCNFTKLCNVPEFLSCLLLHLHLLLPIPLLPLFHFLLFSSFFCSSLLPLLLSSPSSSSLSWEEEQRRQKDEIPSGSITSLWLLTNYFTTLSLHLAPGSLLKLSQLFAYIASVDSLTTAMRILIFDKSCFLVEATLHLGRQGISKIPGYTGLFHVINTKTRANDLTK